MIKFFHIDFKVCVNLKCKATMYCHRLPDKVNPATQCCGPVLGCIEFCVCSYTSAFLYFENIKWESYRSYLLVLSHQMICDVFMPKM